MRYPEPRKHVVAGQVTEHAEGVEIVVETAAQIPIRALSPALFVGRTEIAENEAVSPTKYRFFVLDEKALRPGAAIRLGWVGGRPPKQRARFRYTPPATG